MVQKAASYLKNWLFLIRAVGDLFKLWFILCTAYSILYKRPSYKHSIVMRSHVAQIQNMKLTIIYFLPKSFNYPVLYYIDHLWTMAFTLAIATGLNLDSPVVFTLDWLTLKRQVSSSEKHQKAYTGHLQLTPDGNPSIFVFTLQSSSLNLLDLIKAVLHCNFSCNLCYNGSICYVAVTCNLSLGMCRIPLYQIPDSTCSKFEHKS